MNLSRKSVLLFILCSQLAFAGPDKAPEVGFFRSLLNATVQRFTPEKVDFDPTKRSFMVRSGGAAAGAMVMASGGAGALAALGGKIPLPEDWLKKMARLKAGAPLEQGGIEDYIAALEKELSQTNSSLLRRALEVRINAAKKSVQRIQSVLDPVTGQVRDVGSLKDVRAKLDSMTEISKDPTQFARNQERLKAAQKKLVEHTRSSTELTVAVLTARRLLEPILIRRMGFQIAYTNLEEQEFTIALTEQDLVAIKDYIEMLEALETKFTDLSKPKTGDIYIWLRNLKYEAELSLEAYEVSKENLSIGSCKSLL